MPAVTRAPGPGEPMLGQPTRTPGGGSSMTWNWNLGGINDYLDALMQRMPEIMDIQLSRLREQPQRDAIAFQEWLRKREWERKMQARQQWEAEKLNRERNSMLQHQQGEADERTMWEEQNCAAARAQGLPCAAPGAGVGYGGSSGVPSAAALTPSVGERPEQPAYGPRNSAPPPTAPPPVTVNVGGGAFGIDPAYTMSNSDYFRMMSAPEYWDTETSATRRRDR